MLDRTRQLWERQHRLVGDRMPLFTAVAAELGEVSSVLYPGSYVDITPSFVWPSVVYVDVDRRARRFFDDRAGIAELIAAQRDGPSEFRFIAGDYADDLDLVGGTFDLLVSLYAGFVSEHCGHYLRPGGILLANPSHGDVALASLDPRFRLHGAIDVRDGRARILTDELERYLVPKRDVDITADAVRERGRAVAYTRSAFAYLFRFEG